MTQFKHHLMALFCSTVFIPPPAISHKRGFCFHVVHEGVWSYNRSLWRRHLANRWSKFQQIYKRLKVKVLARTHMCYNYHMHFGKHFHGHILIKLVKITRYQTTFCRSRIQRSRSWTSLAEAYQSMVCRQITSSRCQFLQFSFSLRCCMLD